MIDVRPFNTLGHAEFGWLDAHHHFSFGQYMDQSRMGWGALRVWNDDTISPFTGFDPHGHRDMEIVTYVRKGAITHRDSQGNVGRTEAGDVQVMSAGTGIYHSEFNMESEDISLYQIWIFPREKGVKPQWSARTFPREPVNDRLTLLVSGRKADQGTEDGKAALPIHQDAAIYGGRLEEGKVLTHALSDQAYILISEGEVELDGQTLKKGDGAEVTKADHITITAKTNAEILVIEVPD